MNEDGIVIAEHLRGILSQIRTNNSTVIVGQAVFERRDRNDPDKVLARIMVTNVGGRYEFGSVEKVPELNELEEMLEGEADV